MVSKKKVIIISPYFPPSNAADMQRVRTSLPYFKDLGWEATVVAVSPELSRMVKDEMLLESLPADLELITVEALSNSWTSMLGVGSLGWRSIPFYREKVDDLLGRSAYDLIFFSTTQFPVCILGRYWKKKFGIPFVIDMQDPWYTGHYPGTFSLKQRIVYRIHAWLESRTMRCAGGLVSVSQRYIDVLRSRYPELRDRPAAAITFGAYPPDLVIAAQKRFPDLLQEGYRNIVYVGRGGLDMHRALGPVFEALRQGLSEDRQLFSTFRFYFIGTSYATRGEGTIMPLARRYGLEAQVTEVPGRISYYHTMYTLQHATALLLPGSDDPGYSASKVYPYILTGRPLLAVLHSSSNVVRMLQACTTGAEVVTFDAEHPASSPMILKILYEWSLDHYSRVHSLEGFNAFSAQALTARLAELFDQVILPLEATDRNT